MPIVRRIALVAALITLALVSWQRNTLAAVGMVLVVIIFAEVNWRARRATYRQ